ncbi:MAG: 30S ribosomal protein S9 [Waddliaceae bacterium]
MEEQVATGRRKTAVASIRLRPGKGNVAVNGRKFEEHFPLKIHRDACLAPFSFIGDNKDYDIIIRVKGGGIQGQVDAVKLGVARALIENNETLQPKLKEAGYLTRDPRKKERKKYGLAGARKRFQFSKR